MEAWDIDFVRTRDVVAAVRDRAARLPDLLQLRHAAQPVWEAQERVMREALATFAARVRGYAEDPAAAAL
jgi:hypothetical protein